MEWLEARIGKHLEKPGTSRVVRCSKEVAMEPFASVGVAHGPAEGV